MDNEAIIERMQVIVDTLSLPTAEAEEIMAAARSLPGPDEKRDAATESEERLIEFARDHGQSLDWIFTGDARAMIHAMKEAKRR